MLFRQEMGLLLGLDEIFEHVSHVQNVLGVLALGDYDLRELVLKVFVLLEVLLEHVVFELFQVLDVVLDYRVPDLVELVKLLQVQLL